MTEPEMDAIYEQTKLEYKNKRPRVYYKVRNFVYFINIFIAMMDATEVYLVFQKMHLLTYVALFITIVANITWYHNHFYTIYRRMMSKECDRILETTKRRIENAE